MKTSLIIGMGIGNLYAQILDNLGHGVITVDSNPDKGADFLTVENAIAECRMFDTVHICTPNFTHFELATKVARHTKILFIEKPGVVNSNIWEILVKSFPETRFMMVKNNMWRSNIGELKSLADRSKTVHIKWIRRNCIPNPGSWFTTKKLAYGGVSRDLMPHLLSLYITMNPNWQTDKVSEQLAMACWELKDIDSTEYGTVYSEGIYDVDDVCVINFKTKWKCAANWRSMDKEDSSIEFVMEDDSTKRFELGWCPEEAYCNMITDAIGNINNDEFWENQYTIDSWIHSRIEKL
jgi:predicted dehydrogenase